MLDEVLLRIAGVVVPAVEIMALVVIAIGTVEAFVRGLPRMFARLENPHMIRAIWIRYSRWLIAGLTFQLAGDIMATAAAPSWKEIGQLAAIAVIRTFLNFFLERDQQELRRAQRESAFEA